MPPKAPAQRDRPLLLLLDGHAMVFRAWFSIPERLSTSTGQDTRGAYGFLTTFLKVTRDHRPTHAAVAFDTRAPTFRDKMFPEYKAHRPAVPDDLHAQIGLVRDLMAVFKIPVFEKDGFEADDLIGTISRQAAAAGAETLIVTGDRDALQLVTPGVRVLMYTGFANTKVYDEEAFRERFGGLPPASLPDIKSLEGDPSDNIPGVPGIGAKTALALLQGHERLEALYENLELVESMPIRGAKKARELLERHRDEAFKGRELTTIVCDAPIDFDLDRARFWQYDRAEVVRALSALEFRTVVGQIPDPATATAGPADGEQLALGQEPPSETADAPPALPPEEDVEYTVVRTAEQLRQMIAEIARPEGFAFDTETSSTNPVGCDLAGISFSNRPKRGWYVPVGHSEGDHLSKEEALAALAPVFADASIPKTAHNANFDVTALAEGGLEVQGMVFDTMIAASLAGRRAIGLKQLALDCFQIEMTPISDLIGTGRKQIQMADVPISQAAPYASADADMTWRLRPLLDRELDLHKVRHVFEDIEMPLLPVIVRMQRNGVLVDVDALREMSEQLAEELATLDKEAHEVMGGRDFNLNSTQQLASILIDELGVPRTRRTKTGFVMDAATLEGLLLREDLDYRAHQLIRAVLRHRELSKLKSTYVDALPQLVNPRTGRVHTSFNQVGSATGRLSSADPNVQNIPVRTALGRKVRQAFRADHENGWFLLAADYSQIELRVLAHLSQEPGLLAAFKNREDIHSATARSMYGVEDVTAEQRRIAKILNFGVIYGLSAHGISMQTDLTREQGREFIDLYYRQYPGIREYTERVREEARLRGYVETVAGRRRRLPEITSGNHNVRAAAERMAVNMPIQGTAADVIKVAMIEIDAEMRRRRMKSHMTIQVHDELIFEVAPGEVEDLEGVVTELMPNAMHLSVPLDIEIKKGITWGDME